MQIARTFSQLALAAMACGCDVHDHAAEVHAGKLKGETPQEVSRALMSMSNRLPPEKALELSHAVDTLTRVMPDKMDSRTVGQMSPQFVNMVQGRDADQIIQLAILYRLSAPPNPR